MAREPIIVTFFSARAGIGRTMAVLNTAYRLAMSGRHVLTVDLDLRKPGLSNYLLRNKETRNLGDGDALNLMSWACSALRDRGARTNLLRDAPELHTFLWTPQAKRLQHCEPAVGELGNLHFVGIDARSELESRLERLVWFELGAEEQDAAISVLRDYLKSRTVSAGPDYWGEARRAYDYVLVDCPHGNHAINKPFLETLADRVVVCTDLNDQMAKETRKFLGGVGIQRKREVGDDAWDEWDPEAGAEVPARLGPRPAIVVATPTPAAEIESRNQRLGRIYWTLGPVAVKLSYHPLMVCQDTVFVRDYREEYLSQDYAKLGEAVMALCRDHPAQQAREALTAWETDPGSPLAAAKVMRLWPADPALGESLMRVTRGDFELGSEEDFRQADYVLRLLCDGRAGTIGDLIEWAKMLGMWASVTADPALAHLRRQQAISVLDRLLSSAGLDDAVRADVLFERANLLFAEDSVQEALAAFTEVIELEGADPERRAAALINRGVVRDDSGDVAGAIEDYSRVIDSDELRAETRAKALLNRSLVHDDAGRGDAAEADWNALILLEDLEPAIVGQALYNRGIARKDAGRHEEGVADWSRIIAKQEDYGDRLAAKALIARGAVARTLDRFDDAIADFDAVLAMPDLAEELRAEAVQNRARTHAEAGDDTAARADWSTLESMDVGGGLAAAAALESGVTLMAEEKTAAAIEALTTAVENADTTAVLAEALYNRGIARKDTNDLPEAIADWGRLAELAGASVDMVARALVSKGILLSALGKDEDAREDFSRVIEMPDAPPDCLADALFNRGLVTNDLADSATAIIDFRAAIAVENASSELRARATYARAVAERNCGDLDAAVSNLAELLEMADCPLGLAMKARITRAAIEGERGNFEAAVADFEAVASNAEAPANRRVSAYGGLARLLIGEKEYARAASVCEEALVIMNRVSWIHTVLGVARFHQDDVDGAKEAWSDAIAATGSATSKKAVVEEVAALPDVPKELVAELEKLASA